MSINRQTIRTIRFDIRKKKKNLQKLALFAHQGYAIWFNCGGVMGTGGSSPDIMESIIAPLKHHTAEVYNRRLLAAKKAPVKIPATRKFSHKPPIMVVTFSYLEKVIDWQWLKFKFNLKNATQAKKMVKSLYDNLLLHMILPLKKEYYGLFPFNKENPNKNKVISAAFMCLGGYPPLADFINHYEKTAPKKLSGLPWPFMGTSLAHDEAEPVITSTQAYEYWLEMEIIEKNKVIIFADTLMDEIVEKEWKKGGSQSLIDFINGEEGEILIKRRGTALPEIARDILKQYYIKLNYHSDYKDLYPDQEPPLTTIEQMRVFIERLRI